MSEFQHPPQIFGIGADLVEVTRIAESLEKFGERFERRVFTEIEIAYCKAMPHPELHFAARFAAKEAFLKALGTGKARGISWREAGVENLPSGQPRLVITGRALEICRERKVGTMHLTLSHTRGNAMAVVVIENGRPTEVK